MRKFIARTCAHCGKPKGTFSFRLPLSTGWTRGYYHPACFRVVVRTVAKKELEEDVEEMLRRHRKLYGDPEKGL